MIVTVGQRVATPLPTPLALGQPVPLTDGTVGVVTGVLRPPPDGGGGVLIEVSYEA